MKKALIALVVAAVAGGVYTTQVKGGEPAPPPPKVHGSVYVLPKEFVVNLAEERLLRVTVGMLLDPEKLAHGGEEEAAAKPPEGFGTDPQEALVRDIVLDELTGLPAQRFATAERRAAIKERILKSITSHTDVPATHVLFTDLAVQ
jgi:flagellar basal body-associated protein FliL